MDCKDSFFVVEESALSPKQHLNVVVEIQETSNISYWCDCQPYYVRQIVTSYFKYLMMLFSSLATNWNAFCMILSDAAWYMVAAGTILKSWYPKLFYVTCVAHLCSKSKIFLWICSSTNCKILLKETKTSEIRCHWIDTHPSLSWEDGEAG